jgi:outer membrane protein TolC
VSAEYSRLNEDSDLRWKGTVEVMTRFRFTALLARSAMVACCAIAFANCASAQIGAAPPPSSQATPLPISGRGAQTGGAVVTESPVPSTTTSVNTLNPTISVQGAFAGSANSTAQGPFSGQLSLEDAIQRGMRFNLGAVGMTQTVAQLRGQAKAARSALLPNIRGDIADTEETFNLRSIGVSFGSPGVTIPSLVGPFNVLDVRARISQTIADFTSLNNLRSAREQARAGELSAKDAQDLIVLAVAGAYLQVITANARLESARAQLETSNALYQQTMQQLQFGRATQLDVNRSHVEVLLDQQRLVTLQNDLAKQKINLARLTGLPADADYQLSTEIPYAPAPSLTLDDAIKQALDQRADLKSAEAQVSAAERSLSGARAERLPSISASADYGEIGNPSHLLPTYTISGTLSVPIWNGGRTAADIQQAEAALAQRRAELEDTRSQIVSEVRNAYLDLQAAASQVDVAQQNIDLMGQTLAEIRQRFEAGVSQNVDVVQSQESVASARLDYIDSVFAHNLAKLSLARAIGNAPETVHEFLKFQ